jgi:hypothetical protein
MTSTALLLLVTWATDPVPEPSEVKPGWIALVVVLSLVAATTLLWLSMRRHLGRIQAPYKDETSDAEDEPRPRD